MCKLDDATVTLALVKGWLIVSAIWKEGRDRAGIRAERELGKARKSYSE